MNKIRAVIFDMDGVIFDSERVLMEIWGELSEKYDIRDFQIPYRMCIGVNAKKTRQIMLDFYGPDFPYDKYEREQSAIYHERYDHGKLPLKPGIRELLTFLKEQKLKCAVASSTRLKVVEDQLKAADLYDCFDRITGGDKVTHSKPHPEIFLTTAEALNVPPENCAVIEDSHSGIRAAFAAGMAPIMVPDLLPDNEEMHEKAVCVLKDLFEVKQYLLKTGGELS